MDLTLDYGDVSNTDRGEVFDGGRGHLKQYHLWSMRGPSTRSSPKIKPTTPNE
jgi:hypothetical protein